MSPLVDVKSNYSVAFVILSKTIIFDRTLSFFSTLTSTLRGFELGLGNSSLNLGFLIKNVMSYNNSKRIIFKVIIFSTEKANIY